MLKTKTFNQKATVETVKIKRSIAFIMYLLLLLSYILFIINWIMVLRLGGSAGKNGWVNEFFGMKEPSQTTSQLVSYSITLFRGFATLTIGWLMVKLSHKYAVMIAMALLAMSLPAVFMPNYVLFIIARSFMAIGGTMMIIFLQPVVSRFFNIKQKRILSLFAVQGYVVASMISFGIFLNVSIRDVLLEHWKIAAAVTAGLTLIPLVCYLIIGKNFNFNNASDDKPNSSLKPMTYKEILKEKQTIIWSLYYGLWLIVAVLTTTFVPKILTTINPEIKDYVIEGSIKIGWNAFFGFIFFVGGFFGFIISFLNKTKLRRRPLLVTLMLLKILSFGLIILGTLVNVVPLTFIGSFLIALFIFGSQGIFFTVPHEYEGNSPRRLTIFFGYVWGFGYIIFTICNIIAALLLDHVSAQMSLGFVILIFLATLVFTFLLKESLPTGKWLWKPIKINWKKVHNE